MSLKMKFHKHLAGNMNQLPELFPNRVYKGQDTMVWNTYTEGIAMKGLGLWSSLKIMHELWLNQKTLFRESQQQLGHHSCSHCNRKGERSFRQLPHIMPASCKKVPKRVKSSQCSWLPLSQHFLPMLFLYHHNPFLSQSLEQVWKGNHCLVILSLSNPGPASSLALTPQQPLHSSLLSMPLTERQMDLLTSSMLLPSHGTRKWAALRMWHITVRELQTLYKKAVEFQKMCWNPVV